MRMLPWVLRASGVIAGVVLSAIWQVQLVDRGLTRLDQSSEKTLVAAASALLSKAHARRDDLSFYEVLGVLRESPGVLKAEIVEKAGTWGALVIEQSSRLRKRWQAKYALATLTLFGVWGGGLAALLVRNERRVGTVLRRAQDLSSLLEREQRGRLDVEARARRNLEDIRSVLLGVVGGMDQPFLVLDSRQRIAAISPSAVHRLRVEKSEDIMGKSWVEIPSLAFVGPLIQKRLSEAGSSSWAAISVVE